jgi:hypothetical protein
MGHGPGHVDLDTPGDWGVQIAGTATRRIVPLVAGVGDVNDDGHDDLAVTVTLSGREGVQVLYGPFSAGEHTVDELSANGFRIEDSTASVKVNAPAPADGRA